jgi:cardiolipin synthase A/B
MTLNNLLSPLLLSLHSLAVAIGLLTYVLTSHSLRQRRAPTAAISWVLTIALVPYVGLPFYLLFGTRKLGHEGSWIPATTLQTAKDAAWPRQLAAAMGQPPVATYWSLQVHADGAEAQRALWDTIDGARHDIVLCTFIVGRDPLGRALIKRLIEKARAGVHIRLMIDAVGRIMGGGLSLRRLKAAGVEVELFGPILHMPFRSSANLRNHRKMVVADGNRLWCGGRNFAAEYFEGLKRRAPWRDLSFDMAGPLAAQARELFERDWARATDKPADPPPTDAATVTQDAAEPFAQVIASGPDEADDTVHDLLVTACFKAQGRILAVTPYFVPGDVLQMAMTLAARRGVAVDLVLPRQSNHRMADFARHRALRELSDAGGRVWLVPYMIHAKCVVVDEDLGLAGSANLDARSLFLNYELMVAFYAGADVLRFASFIDKHREAAKPYEIHKPGLLRDLAEGLVLWLAFQL